MKIKNLLILSVVLSVCACSDKDAPERSVPPITEKDFIKMVVDGYWVNTEAYNCREINGTVERLTENLWGRLDGGSGQSIFCFHADGTFREYISYSSDPRFMEKYGKALVYKDGTYRYEESDNRLEMDAMTRIPRSPMSVVGVEEESFTVECEVVQAITDEDEFTQVIFRKPDRAKAEALIEGAISLDEVVFP
ncbi:hypothetical protein [Alistipes sp.]|jgi:lipoprotein|uniref:hypothetical protein n=2 Tax=Alistipes sp. TaxID=1872444 RepID=UPI003AEFE232